MSVLTSAQFSLTNMVGKDRVLDLRRYLDRRLAGLRSDRWSYWQHWRQLSDYILPRRGRYLQTPNQATRGNPVGTAILNETPIFALRTLAAGLMAGLTSPARPWFRLTIRDMDIEDNTPVKLWLDEVTKAILKVLAQTNCYNSLHVIYEELGCFGTGVLLIEEDTKDLLRCQTLTAGEYYLAMSGSNTVNTLYREYMMSVGAMVERFGLGNCSVAVQQAYKDGRLDPEQNIAQAIEPNDDRAPQIPGLKGRPFRSAVWEVAHNEFTMLELRGYHEIPFMAPRWHVIGNDAYGRSPGMEALGSSKEVQHLERRMAQAIDKILNPPMVADPSMRNEATNLLPGGITYADMSSGKPGFAPAYQISPNWEGALKQIERKERLINQAFFADLFLMISQLDTVRTATEIIERKQEKMLMLGPFLERSQNELINPFIERVFGIMSRKYGFKMGQMMAALPPPPREIRGKSWEVETISVLADAQKSTATTGIERLVAFVGNLIGVKPEVGDNVDFDEAVREYADYLGVTQKLVVALDKRDATRRARAAQAQEAQQLQTSMAAAQGAKTLSETDVGGGQNALQKMLGLQEGGLAA